jgi:hypothetical protein
MIAIGRADLFLANKGSERSLSWVQGWPDGDAGVVLRNRYHMLCTPVGYTMRVHASSSERTTCSATSANERRDAARVESVGGADQRDCTG